MFSLKTLHLRFRRYLPAIAGTVAFLLAAELAFRHGDWFHDYGGWESPGLQKKMEGGEKLFQREGHIDLVTLSTSVGRAMDVTQWIDATSDTLVAYNYGFPDQRPERQNFLFQNYMYPRYKPKYVIYGLSLVDCNANVRGMNPEHPRSGPFWSFRNVSKLSAETFTDKLIARLDQASVLFRSRHRARFSLQHGPIAMLPEEPTIGNGVLVPTIRRQPFGPMLKSWALDPLGMPYNAYHDYWIPDDGEIGEVIKLGKFCRKHDIKFAVVEFPNSPYGHTNWDNGKSEYWKFTNALDFIASKGIQVFPMARDLRFDNTHFQDQEHLNRWGSQMVTEYVYQHIVKPWLNDPSMPASLNRPLEFHPADISTSAPGIIIAHHDPVTPEAQYAADKQMLIQSDSDQAVLVTLTTGTLDSGSYAVELFAGDGTTTTPELTGKAKLTLLATENTGKTIASMPLDKWILSESGVSYTQAYFFLPAAATLKLQVDNSDQLPFILDTVFVRRRLSTSPDEIIVK